MEIALERDLDEKGGLLGLSSFIHRGILCCTAVTT